MAEFVVNEWLWSDSRGDNGPERQREVVVWLQRLANSENKVVFVEGSEFDRKAWALCKHDDPNVQLIGKAFVLGVRQDSNRGRILKEDQLGAVPDSLAGVKPGDQYLVRALVTVPDAILVTTDIPLHEAVNGAGLKAIYRDEFLRSFAS